MKYQEPVVTQVLNLSGDLILDVSHEAGYHHQSVTGTGGVRWRENLTESAYVEGSAVVTPAVRASVRRVERIDVDGDASLTGDAFWRSVEDRIVALEEAVSSQFLWTVGIGGYLWTYRTLGPADVDVSEFDWQESFAFGSRTVVLSFTVQPNPTKVAL